MFDCFFYLTHKPIYKQTTNNSLLTTITHYQTQMTSASIKASPARSLARNARIAESQMLLVNKLVAFMGKKIEIAENMMVSFDEFKGTLQEDLDVDTYHTYYAAKLKKANKESVEKKPRSKRVKKESSVAEESTAEE
jgi:hypothetical protein